MKSKRIILDTNLWISLLITNNFNHLDDFITDGKIILIFSNELLEEFVSVAMRPKFKKYFSKKDIDQLLSIFDSYGTFIKVVSNVNICRDPKDNFLLNLAIDGQVDYLVTGDSDLLVIGEINNTKIITMKALSELLK